MTRGRAGFTIIELLVAMVIAGIIGVALTRLLISQARFVSLQDGSMRARAGARAALNVLAAELRSVTDSGVILVSADSIVVRVPYAFGVACQQTSGATVVSLLPTDSATYAAAAISGYAWRDSVGAYRVVQPATVAASSTSWCTGATPSVTTLSTPHWGPTAVAASPNVVATPVGAPVYLFQTIRYVFAPSLELPGRRALWRAVPGAGLREELVAPFDSIARFQFLVGANLTLRSSPAPPPDSLYGVRVRLVTASETPPQGRTVPVRFDLSSDIIFRNRVR